VERSTLPVGGFVEVLTWDICLHGKGTGNDRAVRASRGGEKGLGDSRVETKSGKRAAFDQNNNLLAVTPELDRFSAGVLNSDKLD
jgi:hypothetical protein